MLASVLGSTVCAVFRLIQLQVIFLDRLIEISDLTDHSCAATIKAKSSVCLQVIDRDVI